MVVRGICLTVLSGLCALAIHCQNSTLPNMRYTFRMDQLQPQPPLAFAVPGGVAPSSIDCTFCWKPLHGSLPICISGSLINWRSYGFKLTQPTVTAIIIPQKMNLSHLMHHMLSLVNASICIHNDGVGAR